MGISLTKGELLLLRYLDNHREKDRIPNYFIYQHQLDVDKCIDKLWNNGLITYASAADTLKHCTVQQLKELLTENGLSVSGNKKSLIDRLASNVDETLLLKRLDKYMVITDDGKKALENLSDFEYSNRYDEYYVITDIENTIKSITENNFVNLNTGIPMCEEYDKSKIEACKKFYRDDNTLSNDVKAIIITKFLDGSRYETAKKSIKYYLDKDVTFSSVARPIRWLRSYSELNQLKQSDIPFKYKIKSLGDSCECCKALEDKEFDLKDAVIGVNYPPFNNCTCDVCRCFASHNINENN